MPAAESLQMLQLFWGSEVNDTKTVMPEICVAIMLRDKSTDDVQVRHQQNKCHNQHDRVPHNQSLPPFSSSSSSSSRSSQASSTTLSTPRSISSHRQPGSNPTPLHNQTTPRCHGLKKPLRFRPSLGAATSSPMRWSRTSQSSRTTRSDSSTSSSNTPPAHFR